MNRQEIIAEIVELQKQIHRVLDGEDASRWVGLTLTRAQLRITRLLFIHERMSPGEIATALGVPKANVTGAINRLVAQGLAARREDLNDRRSYILCLTDEGRQQVSHLFEMNTERLEGSLDRMNQEDLDALTQGLQALLVAMKKTSVAQQTPF